MVWKGRIKWDIDKRYRYVAAGRLAGLTDWCAARVWWPCPVVAKKRKPAKHPPRKRAAKKDRQRLADPECTKSKTCAKAAPKACPLRQCVCPKQPRVERVDNDWNDLPSEVGTVAEKCEQVADSVKADNPRDEYIVANNERDKEKVKSCDVPLKKCANEVDPLPKNSADQLYRLYSDICDRCDRKKWRLLVDLWPYERDCLTP